LIKYIVSGSYIINYDFLEVCYPVLVVRILSSVVVYAILKISYGKSRYVNVIDNEVSSRKKKKIMKFLWFDNVWEFFYIWLKVYEKENKKWYYHERWWLLERRVLDVIVVRCSLFLVTCMVVLVIRISCGQMVFL